ncbi:MULTISPECIES: hypothetical protein [unclassified Microcoleus]|uniref:hypothetical protein n=1 Tax=unclassified Microcoleus TaxID=2642155 RepID=UPI002FD6D443
MSVLLPWIGVTDCTRAKYLLNNCTQNIVGSFWLMCGYGFKTENIPSWWIDLVSEENQAQAIVEKFDEGWIVTEHEDPLYLGFCIIVVTDRSNPASLSYVIQHTRMENFEGIGLLRIMAKHNIPALTKVAYPKDFLHSRYPEKSEAYKLLKGGIKYWNVEVWEDYCSYQMAEHGQIMLAKYWEKMNIN